MQSVDKKYFSLNKGINTEAPLVAWPEGFTIDEQNFDLLSDGSRRRRLGLNYETGTSNSLDFPSAEPNLDSGTRFYRWKNVANTDEFNFLVAQVGPTLYFWNDVKSGPLGVYIHSYSLLPHRVMFTDPATDEYFEATDTQVSRSTVSFSEADGRLIVVGEHLEPLAISYEENEIVGNKITIEERDLFGIDDGIDVSTKPTTLTPEHEYNLISRGWESANIEAVFTAEDFYPAKNMIQYMGMRRQTDAGYADEDGIKTFTPEKLLSELFSNMSAPQGHIRRDVFNRRYGLGDLSQATVSKTIASVSEVHMNEGHMRITTADAAHEVEVGQEIEIRGMVLKVSLAFAKFKIPMDGVYEVTELIDTNTFKIDIGDKLEPYGSYVGIVEKGQYTKDGLILVSFAGTEPSQTRFTSVAAFAGRLFYGGCPDTRLTDKIYFSKSIENHKDFGKCFQEADPTSEFISDLLPTDGGYITIPNLGTLRAMLPYGRALLLFSSEGVWAIGPGEGGLFAATSYSVQKITDAGCIAKQSVIMADGVPMYWSNAGIYGILQDSNSGFLSAENATEHTINGLYNSIRYTEKTRVKAGYDPVRKRAFWLYNSRLLNPPDGVAPAIGDTEVYSTSVTPLGELDDTEVQPIVYDSVLIFDLRLKAWIRWSFGISNIKVRDVLLLPTTYDTDTLNGSVRFLCQENLTTKHYLSELSSEVYEDWGVEAPAYILTGPDSLGEPERFRTAPYVHVFMRRESIQPRVSDQDPDGGEVAPIGSDVDLILSGRQSSLFMQTRWDWARGSDSGKISNYVQVYRETKTRPDAFGMVVTKNKVRGRGRNLFLAFKAGARSPAWIDGYTVKYDVTGKI